MEYSEKIEIDTVWKLLIVGQGKRSDNIKIGGDVQHEPGTRQI